MHCTTMKARSESVEIIFALSQGELRLLLARMRWLGNAGKKLFPYCFIANSGSNRAAGHSKPVPRYIQSAI